MALRNPCIHQRSTPRIGPRERRAHEPEPASKEAWPSPACPPHGSGGMFGQRAQPGSRPLLALFEVALFGVVFRRRCGIPGGVACWSRRCRRAMPPRVFRRLAKNFSWLPAHCWPKAAASPCRRWLSHQRRVAWLSRRSGRRCARWSSPLAGVLSRRRAQPDLLGRQTFRRSTPIRSSRPSTAPPSGRSSGWGGKRRSPASTADG
jgi:hypothetical protein